MCFFLQSPEMAGWLDHLRKLAICSDEVSYDSDAANSQHVQVQNALTAFLNLGDCYQGPEML